MASSTPLPPRPRTEGGPRVRTGRLEKLGSTRGSMASSVSGRSAGGMSGSSGGAAMSADIERIQVQTGVFQKKTRMIRSEIRGLEDEIRYYKQEINKYRKSMGGLTALPLNDMYVQQEIAIMEKRLVKAKTHYMNCIEHNRALRMQVDEVRRERIIQQDVSARLRADVEAMRRDTEEVEESIVATEKQTVKVIEQTEDFRKRANEVLAAKESEFYALDDGGPEGFVIPTTPPAMESPRGAADTGGFNPHDREEDDLPPVDAKFFESLSTRLGDLTAKQEARLREKVGTAMWDSVIVTISEQQMSERVEKYEEIFEEIKRTLGVEDLDGFNDLFAYREEQNYAILCSINDLNEETTRIEEQIHRAESARKALIDAAATENVERRKSSDALQARLRESSSRLSWYHERLEELQDGARAFKTGVGRIYGGLNGLTKDEEVPGLTETNMIRFLAVVEQQVFQLFKMYLQQKASPAKRLHSSLPRSGSSRRLGASGMAEEDVARMKQGPNVKPHTLRKTLTAAMVEPPEVAAISAGASAAGDEKDDEDANGVSRPMRLEAIRKLTMSLHSTQSLVSPVTPAARAGKTRGGERRTRRSARKASTRS
mmetsp:Transcript_140359/g.341030  ORF Transcript_140359/g.341030 Transcript_140359/m.341030 type:complete len:600 (+) Transcript_140359:58-1857(+)